MLQRKDVIFRYFSEAKFWDFLKRRSIYMSRLDQFSDLWERSPPTGYSSHSFWRHIMETSQNTAQYTALHDVWANIARDQALGDYYGGNVNLRASCWTLLSDDAALWHIYADRKTGVLVSTSVERLLSQIPEPPADGTKSVLIAPVMYVDYGEINLQVSENQGFNHKEIFPSFVISQIASLYKHKSFSFENEVRILACGNEDSLLKLNSFEFVTEVVVAPDANEDFFRRISEGCQTYGITAPIRKSALTPPVPPSYRKYEGPGIYLDEHPGTYVVPFVSTEEFFLWYQSISQRSLVPRFSQGLPPIYSNTGTLFHYGFVRHGNGRIGAIAGAPFAQGFANEIYNGDNEGWVVITPEEFNMRLAQLPRSV